MRMSDWSSDVCSSDLGDPEVLSVAGVAPVVSSPNVGERVIEQRVVSMLSQSSTWLPSITTTQSPRPTPCASRFAATCSDRVTISSKEYTRHGCRPPRSEEHTSELQSLMRISYAVFC